MPIVERNPYIPPKPPKQEAPESALKQSRSKILLGRLGLHSKPESRQISPGDVSHNLTQNHATDIQNIQLPEILIDQMTLYHGSATHGIEALDVSEENTVGKGVYLLDNAKDARGYARRRTGTSKDSSPVVYEAQVENLKLINLNNEQKLQETMNGFAEELKRAKAGSSDKAWYVIPNIDKALDAIAAGIKVGQVKEVTHSFGLMFSNYLMSLGYDGLKTPEGGEGSDIGRHETYLIFDPQKVKITSEQPVR